MKTAFSMQVIAISLVILIGPVHMDEIFNLAAHALDFLTERQFSSHEDIFNLDPRIEDGFLLLFQFIQGYLLHKNVLSVKYLLYTTQNPDKQHIFVPTQNSLNESGFDSTLETKIIIHGYTVKLVNTSIFFDIKDQLLLEGDYNVILVDWTDYNNTPYILAFAYSYLVGLDLANFISFLMNNTNVSAELFHIIGHSLGAHIAAITGKTTCDLGRISGLDAAGPVFQILPKYLKLTHTDAKFVDAVHTNGQISALKGFGTLNPYADIDFFPNGGSTQPNCEEGDIFLNYEKENVTVDSTTVITCNHARALYLFLASINNTRCRFLSIRCHSYEEFNIGNCHSSPYTVAEMGFHAKPIPSLNIGDSFFLNTSDEFPYCIPIEQ